MKTKKTVALVLALLLVFALFAGCNNGGGSNTPATQAPATQAPATQTEAPVEDEGPIHLPRGKYAVDAEGWPVEKYVYDNDKPICESDSPRSARIAELATASVPRSR